jgi:hypothetical protein
LPSHNTICEGFLFPFVFIFFTSDLVLSDRYYISKSKRFQTNGVKCQSIRQIGHPWEYEHNRLCKWTLCGDARVDFKEPRCELVGDIRGLLGLTFSWLVI